MLTTLELMVKLVGTPCPFQDCKTVDPSLSCMSCVKLELALVIFKLNDVAVLILNAFGN